MTSCRYAKVFQKEKQKSLCLVSENKIQGCGDQGWAATPYSLSKQKGYILKKHSKFIKKLRPLTYLLPMFSFPRKSMCQYCCQGYYTAHSFQHLELFAERKQAVQGSVPRIQDICMIQIKLPKKFWVSFQKGLGEEPSQLICLHPTASLLRYCLRKHHVPVRCVFLFHLGSLCILAKEHFQKAAVRKPTSGEVGYSPCPKSTRTTSSWTDMALGISICTKPAH